MLVNKAWLRHLDTTVRELLCNHPTRKAICLWEHLNARTYVSGLICMIGDVVHATTPFTSSGGGMCDEDMLILTTLLNRAVSHAEAVVAFKVYDQVRRPCTQHVVEASRSTGYLMIGKDETVGLDAEKLKKALTHRWNFIFDFDYAKHRDEAVGLMAADLERNVIEAISGAAAFNGDREGP